MRKKHKRQLLAIAIANLFLLGQSIAPQQALAAASGNYTDLLPIGAASDTTVISRGTGWAVTTLPTSQTFGDALSRLSYTAYQATATATISNSTTVSTFTALSQGNVGSTTFPASWVATGRSIRITAYGVYGSSSTTPTWKWDLNIGTMTVLTTGAVNVHANQSNQTFRATGLLTIAATGGSGSANAHWEVITSSGSNSGSPAIVYSTSTVSAVTVDWLTQLTVNPRFTWGSANTSNTIRFNGVFVEFLN